MKNWKKYSKYLMTGEWHIHTKYTDGINSVDDYCRTAEELGIPLLAFTEHVRAELSYDHDCFLEDIDKAREQYDLIILSGCEVKVLIDGNLDVDDSILKQVDYPIFAFHSFPVDLNKYIEALRNVLDVSYINAWAHPSSFLKRNSLDLSSDNLLNIFNMLRDNEILIEQNYKHGVPPEDWRYLAEKMCVAMVRGSDCHSIDDLIYIHK